MPSLSLKDDVTLILTHNETARALGAVIEVFFAFGKDVTITSGCDGKHQKGSKHYKHFAFDVRGRELTEEEFGDVIYQLRQKLGSDYDVVESSHRAIHIEYDPK